MYFVRIEMSVWYLKRIQKVKKLLFIFMLFNFLISFTQENVMNNIKNIYGFKVIDINGNIFDFSSLKGKKVMIVNTASECGLTPQFKDLQLLYDKYKDANFLIIGFPSNDFGGQDPHSNEVIKDFCQKQYGVTFPMMSKIYVKGLDVHEIYLFLTQKDLNGYSDNIVEWNFQKYLINEEGVLEKVINPSTSPSDEEIINWIEK